VPAHPSYGHNFIFDKQPHHPSLAFKNWPNL